MDSHIDLSGIILETGRLILRSFTEADLGDFFDYASVPGVGEMAGWPHHESMETSRRIMQSFMDGKEVFAIYHKQDRKVIGSVGLHKSWANEDIRFKHLPVKEIGYVLAKEYWGQGLMPEAVKAVIDCCFGQLGLKALTCGHFITNDQSRRVIEKCGFSFVRESEYFSSQMQQTFQDRKYILLRREPMSLVFICYPRCSTCQKARKWLSGHRIDYTERNIKENNPNEVELIDWIKKSDLPASKFFNTSGLLYRELDVKSKRATLTEEEQIKLLASDGMLVKRPILVGDGLVLVGFNEKEWTEALQVI